MDISDRLDPGEADYDGEDDQELTQGHQVHLEQVSVAGLGAGVSPGVSHGPATLCLPSTVSLRSAG